jgi:CRP-like cAMP-binding protein
MTGRSLTTAQALAEAELFSGLPLAALKHIAASARGHRLPAGTQVFHQGDANVRAHVVIDGGVRIVQTGSDGAQTVMRFISPGEMFGTVALFTDGRYPADAVTLVDTFEASWSEQELLELIERYPTIGINALRIIGRRLQEVQNRVRELATQSAEQRIAHALTRLARQHGRDTPQGITIAFPLRRKDIADIAGTTLYTASRIVTGWENKGLLSSQRRYLTLREPNSLQKISERTTR